MTYRRGCTEPFCPSIEQGGLGISCLPGIGASWWPSTSATSATWPSLCGEEPDRDAWRRSWSTLPALLQPELGRRRITCTASSSSSCVWWSAPSALERLCAAVLRPPWLSSLLCYVVGCAACPIHVSLFFGGVSLSLSDFPHSALYSASGTGHVLFVFPFSSGCDFFHHPGSCGAGFVVWCLVVHFSAGKLRLLFLLSCGIICSRSMLCYTFHLQFPWCRPKLWLNLNCSSPSYMIFCAHPCILCANFLPSRKRIGLWTRPTFDSLELGDPTRKTHPSMLCYLQSRHVARAYTTSEQTKNNNKNNNNTNNNMDFDTKFLGPKQPPQNCFFK